MKAVCPSCYTTYRVADEKVPPGGARIKCPKCQLVFVVRAPAEQAGGGDKPPSPPARIAFAGHEQATPMQHLAESNTQAPGQPAAALATPALPNPPVAAPAPAATPLFSIPGVSAIRAQGTAAPQRSFLDSYRVRTVKGLTYDFSSREAMLRWLATHNDREDCEVSEPGGDWHPATGLLDLNPPAKSTAELVALTPGEPLTLAASKGTGARAVPETVSAGSWIPWAITAVIWLAALATGAATLTRYGVADLSWLPPLQTMGIEFPATAHQTAKTAVVDQKPEEIYKQAMIRARQALGAGRFSRAALEFNRALSVRAGSREALEGYATACERLGDMDRARSARDKLQAISAP